MDIKLLIQIQIIKVKVGIMMEKKRQSTRRLVSQIDDFDQDVIFGNTMNIRQETTMVNGSSAGQGFTVGNSDKGVGVIEYVVKVKVLERCFDEELTRN